MRGIKMLGISASVDCWILLIFTPKTSARVNPCIPKCALRLEVKVFVVSPSRDNVHWINCVQLDGCVYIACDHFHTTFAEIFSFCLLLTNVGSVINVLTIRNVITIVSSNILLHILEKKKIALKIAANYVCTRVQRSV